MPDPVFAVGTTAAYVPVAGGSSVTMTGLTAIGGNTKQRAVADITLLSETTMKRRPVRTDHGTVQFTFQLQDTATATNEWTGLNTILVAGTLITVTVNMPGAFDATPLYTFSGFISELTTPELGANDTTVTYTATLTLTA